MRRGRIEIIGMGHYEPEGSEVVSVVDYISRQRDLQNPVAQQTLTSVGIERRIQTDRTVLELAVAASEAAIQDATTHHDYFKREHIAAVICGGSTPDRIYPGTAHQLQHALGLEAVSFGHDVSAACCSWTAAVLTLRGQMLTQDYPLWYGLVCIPDRTGMDMASIHDRNSFLWGNGAGATILVYNPGGSPEFGIIGSTGILDGSRSDWIVARGGLGVNPAISSEDPNVDFGAHGKAIQRYVLQNLPHVIRQYMEGLQIELTERTFLLPHNANLALAYGIGERLDIPQERVLTSLRDYGNTSGASIPITLSRYARSTFQSGDLLILASFGAGMMLQVIFYRWP